MEADGDLKKMTKMLKELTLDSSTPTLAVLGSKVGGGKLMVAVTDNTIASERYNAVEILKEIAGHINGGGGGRPTMAQGGGTNPEGLDSALQAARDLSPINCQLIRLAIVMLQHRNAILPLMRPQQDKTMRLQKFLLSVTLIQTDYHPIVSDR